jgi:hypothetical protein
VFQKVAGGHPKFGAEREVRSSSSALTASRLGAPRVPKKNKRLTIFLAAQTGRTDWPHTPQPVQIGAGIVAFEYDRTLQALISRNL